MSSDTQAALLTLTQREFLRGEADFEWDDSSGRTVRTRMRKRLYRGLRDFSYLADPNRLADRDVEQLGDNDRQEDLDEALCELIAFVYRNRPDRFTEIIEEGVRRGVHRFDPEYDVGDVQIPIQKHGHLLDSARRKMETDNPLTDAEIRVMVEHGEIPLEKLREYIRAHPSTRADAHPRRFR